MVEENGVHGLAHRLVAAEREGEVGDAAGNMDMRQGGRDLAGGLDEVDAVIIVLLDAGRDGEDIGIEDDVFGRKPDLLGQELVGPGADLDFSRLGIGLPLFVERHDDHGSAIGAAKSGVMQESFLAFLHGDGIDDRLALHAFEPGLDHLPFRTVDHHRNPSDIRLGGDQVEILDHRLFRIDQAFVHVDVDDLGAVGDLVPRDVERRGIIAGRDELSKLCRAGHIGPFADIDEGDVLGEREGLQPRQLHQRRAFGWAARWMPPN